MGVAEEWKLTVNGYVVSSTGNENTLKLDW